MKIFKRSIWLAICSTVLLVGCGESVVGEQKQFVKNDNYCKPDTKKERADFILQCIANANPKSDEEPEDWIRKCQYMAEETLCDLTPVTITKECARTGLFGECISWREINKAIANN